MRFGIFVGALALVAACSPTVPESGAPDEDYFLSGKARAEAERARTGETTTVPVAVPEPTAVSEETLQTLENTAPETGAKPPATTQPGVKMQDGVVQATPSNPAPEIIDNPGISDENDFEAVGGRRSIESDAERLRRNREQFRVIEPGELPRRVDGGPNVVAYAIQTDNPVGVRIYRRVTINARARFDKNCAKFASGDQAQQEFLTRGGPKRDPKGLDPDGDGFACDWDPTPFRRAAGG